MQALFILWFGFMHPFYVSVTEIKHNPKTQAVEVSCRMFYDDLEHALEKDNKVALDIVKPKDKAQLNRFINEYVKRHLSIRADGKVLNLSYVGYEIQEDGAWAYFEVKGISSVKKIDIHDDLLNTLHPEQINMLHVTIGGNRKSTKLDAPDSDTSFSF
ncbi:MULTISPECIES: DUF6702 family protein [unclassified Mucilaginibacter]|uniref:DUF6702 family protein n=1 Tax=unclassified Mucilaginibacter TaxID=2617802 RepID=UPI002AC8B6FF|nr:MULTISPECIES: DUF6702 family protein [unclassified Mucilaginibacter]MEB0249017.1 hypothetical protein [Mucilaginibacter sp. 5B2]MEB0263362.1 hypothetical protein [Mucilaginibacter sp. 10I4]MEB0279291.1 hypothetical protein [Mucilaginibacter sp. 10B2]MEB0302997.1 hypothetical protein [Mucilaginibacter sp. 5C4]WPX23197.1 hypothetical protein RHM67_18110 [Mucilaginibacter sp. 5C4]